MRTMFHCHTSPPPRLPSFSTCGAFFENEFVREIRTSLHCLSGTKQATGVWVCVYTMAWVCSLYPAPGVARNI